MCGASLVTACMSTLAPSSNSSTPKTAIAFWKPSNSIMMAISTRNIALSADDPWIRARTLPIRMTPERFRVAGIAEDITDYKQLVLAEQEQRALAEALRDIANALNSSVDMAEVLDRLLTNLGHVVPHDAAEIMLIDGERARIARSRGYASRGLQEEIDELDFVVAETPNLQVMRQTRRPLIIPDVEHMSEGQMLNVTPAVFWRSYAGVPIAAKGEVIGFINLGSLIPYFFTPIHADRLQAFAEQAAIAIQNARLHEETRELAAHHERQRLARDLHDAVSQLFAVTISTETLMRQAERDPASLGPKLRASPTGARRVAETRAVLLSSGRSPATSAWRACSRLESGAGPQTLQIPPARWQGDLHLS